MTVDMKEWIQNRADEVAMETLGKEYYDLGPHMQAMCYAKAMEDWADYYANLIDAAYDREKERQLEGK